MADSPNQQNNRRNLAPVGELSRAGTLLLIAGIIAFSVLMYTVRDVIHPFVMCGLVLILLYPIRRDRYIRPIMGAAIILSLIWGLYDVSGVLVPFALAFVFAFLFDPVVTRAERFLPRWASALIIILIILGIFTVLGIYFLPPLFDQLGVLTHSLTSIMKSATFWYNHGGLNDFLNRFNFPRESVKAFIKDQVSPRLQSLLEATLNGALAFVSNTSNILGQLVNVIIIPILGFYLLKDFPAMRSSVHRFLKRINPSDYAAGLLHEVDGLLSAYLRGQALVATIMGTLAGILFMIFGIPFAFVLGFMVFVFDYVPILGLIASLVVSLSVVQFGDAPSLQGLITVGAIILVLHVTEVYFISPRIIGKKVGLHPVIIILSLFIFARLIGFFGLLIAVPSTAVLTFLLRQWIGKVEQSVEEDNPPADAGESA